MSERLADLVTVVYVPAETYEMSRHFKSGKVLTQYNPLPEGFILFKNIMGGDGPKPLRNLVYFTLKSR